MLGRVCIVFAFVICCVCSFETGKEELKNCYPNLRYEEASPAAVNPAVGYFLTGAAKQSGAVCLDGSPGAYYHRVAVGSGANKWHLHHQGGGWCTSIEDCYQRSLTTLGSSKSYPKTMDLNGGSFSPDPSQNPLMYNWNLVFLPYCDGGSFSGSNDTVTNYNGHDIYFRGHNLLVAIIQDLLVNRGLKDATDVVISGCSAGAMTTFLHLDLWRDSLPPTAKVVGMPDSGFFLDYSSPSHDFHGQLVWVFEQMEAVRGVNQKCIKAHLETKDTWKCMFAQYTSPYISTPTFPLQSAYDRWQIVNELGTNSTAAVNAYGKALTQLLFENLLHNPVHGVFLDSCYRHCGPGWQIIQIDGTFQAEAFTQWYTNSTAKRIWNQNKPFPCPECCQKP